jgi:putative redox protein
MISARSLVQPYRTVAGNGHHALTADAPAGKGGGGAGFSAHELLEAALAVCVNMAVRMYAAEHSIPLASATTHVSLRRPGKGIVRFEYALQLSGPLSSAQREQLWQAAGTCPVHETLAQRIEFHAEGGRFP